MSELIKKSFDDRDDSMEYPTCACPDVLTRTSGCSAGVRIAYGLRSNRALPSSGEAPIVHKRVNTEIVTETAVSVTSTWRYQS
jgi:hypothetical protein